MCALMYCMLSLDVYELPVCALRESAWGRSDVLLGPLVSPQAKLRKGILQIVHIGHLSFVRMLAKRAAMTGHAK